MSNRTVYCHLSSKSNGGNHISYLADNMVSQEPPGVIFNYSIDNTIYGHYRSQPY
ncbi:MAG: hypothetical protein DDT26_02483 [Dehalococcoidia bacterium]|nr:hypothetical protein [Chloroflexota bacterium]